jgi:hypothetical protein
VVVVVWLQGREEEEWCLGVCGGCDCDNGYMPKSGVSEAAADGGPEMQLVAEAKAGGSSARAVRSDEWVSSLETGRQ